MPPAIEATGVRRAFGSVPAVRDATFTTAPGRITGLVGPNGSGKTTLLLMLSSLLAPDAGEIRIAGVDPLADAAGVRRAMGWMPDALGAWGSLTATETLTITGELYGMRRPVARDRAAELLRTVDLVPLADSPARVLSRGQKQRLGLARALVHNPQVLLLDEPASGLDPGARVDLRTLLRGFAAEGRGILISSHVLSELEEIADDAVYLLDGATVDAERVAATSRTRTWALRVAGTDGTSARDAVAAALGIAPATVGSDRDHLLVPFAAESDAADALATLIGAGIRVVEFAPATGEMEHTLLDLRRGVPPETAVPPQGETTPPSETATEGDA